MGEPRPHAGRFLGRSTEREALDRLMADVHGGQSAALVIRGEAGIGKTTLLRYAEQQATGFRVAHFVGVEAEMELPFAGLHQLCAPMLARLEALPRPQGDALRVALGLSSGDSPDRFLVGLAVLGLLSAIAEERPLLCLVDDAQWLDAASEQVLGFVGRRLPAEPVALVFAVREPRRERGFEGLPDLPIRGLDEDGARALLARAAPGRIEGRVRDRIVAEARGNPLALLDLPRSVTTTELANGLESRPAAGVRSRVEEHYGLLAGALPEATQQLMLLAAADAVGDATLLWSAAENLGIAASALEPAAEAELLEIGTEVRFGHPLVRSAVYRSASPDDRRRAHQALAEVSDPDADPDRRAWHRALATAGPDEGAADELERSAGRAQTRAGIAAAAAFLERAAALTIDPANHARRALDAARAKHQAGAPDTAQTLLSNGQAGPLNELQRAQADVVRAEIAFTSNRGREAPWLLLKIAKQLEKLDVTLARETYLEALMAAQFAGRLAGSAAVEVARAARAAPPAPTPGAADLLLDGLALMITEGHGVATPTLNEALERFRDGDAAETGGFRWLWLAEQAAVEMWDHDTWRALARREVELVRDAGALTALPLALSAMIASEIFAGELSAAASSIDEVEVAIDATGSRLAPYGSLLLAAWRGRETELSALTETTLEDVISRGEGIAVSTCQWANALLHNSLGRYEQALADARQVLEPPKRLDATINWALPELIEAAARSGHEDLGREALAQLSRMTRAGGTDWALAVEARSRALLSDHDEAEGLYQEAIERLARTEVRGEHARAHLLYGEWLRREGRRSDARERLRTAHRLFTDMGLEAFADRARRELRATGETVRQRTVETRDDLTPQELQVARLARDGLSNPEIGARLFLSPRTVEWHLGKVFTKLRLRSRRELSAALSRLDPEPTPA